MLFGLSQEQGRARSGELAVVCGHNCDFGVCIDETLALYSEQMDQ